MAGVIVDYGNKVVPYMTLLFVALRILFEVSRHQGGHVKDNLSHFSSYG